MSPALTDRIRMEVTQGFGDIVETPPRPGDGSLKWKRTVCPYCGVGCGLLVGHKDGKVVRIRGDEQHPANLGLLCAKGVTLPQMLDTPDRLLYPHQRGRRDAPFGRVTWDTALDRIAGEWKRIIRDHGPDAVAFYISGQLTTEDYYVVNKLMKAALGTNNVDSNSRLCMSSAVSGYVSSLGADAPPGCFADLELADCFFLIGSNTAACHPVTFERIRRRKEKAGSRVTVIVADPRRNKTGELADIFLPVLPGTDVALMNGMLHVLMKEGFVDADFIRDHTSGWEAMRATADTYPPERAAELCGVDQEDLIAAARAFGKAKAALSCWALGLNQSTSGTAKNNAVINLHLATGQIGRPGAGPFSLTGQPNAMGGREAGGLSHLLPGHRFIANAEDRRESEVLWNVPIGRISPTPGLSAVELFDALADGRVKSVWVMGTNPAVSMPNLRRVRAALECAELVIVSDPYHPTETTLLADILLPAAQWSERDGTVTNSERAISYLSQVIDPPGEAIPDWEAVCMFARAMGLGEDFRYTTASEVYEDYKRFTRDQDLDISGVSYTRLQKGPLHWPCPSPTWHPTLRRYTDGVFAHPDGRAKFLAHEYREPAEKPDANFPMILTTGRVRDQWHTMTRTGKIPSLLKRDPEPFVEIHPVDAFTLGITADELVVVTSRRGEAQAKAVLTANIRQGTCFMPFHWGALWGRATVNNATIGAFDPISKQPELKFCAVKLGKAPAGASEPAKVAEQVA